ncbi:MAG: sucrose phosphorylase [Lachnospiraceae bacterium]|nr:sucrose phosphorylase [Lachnospiraceae bacterium]
MIKNVSNKILLITSPDSLGQNLKDLNFVLSEYLDKAVSGIHILPFFPSSGDRGFAPVTYDQVEPAFGDWDDIQVLSEKYYLMCDYMINHMSVQSAIYQDYLEKHEASRYHDFFIKWNKFWDGEPTQEDESKLYKRQDVPYINARFKDGTTERLWTTFSAEQIDIDCLHSEEAKKFLAQQLRNLAGRGISLIRADAMAYAAKRKGTSCFFVEPEMWDLMKQCQDALDGTGVEVLPEIHENYFIQQKLQEKDIYTYDFQLPMLILNAVYFGRTLYLKNWMKLCPRKQFTTLDTHDGIGVVDVRYLLPDEEVLETKQRVFEQNPEIHQLYTVRNLKVNFSKFDTYQINCTYYDALGSDDNKYLMARAVQFFTPGIPQVYYVGLFAGRNDFDYFHETGQSRDVNRHNYTLEEIEEAFRRPVVQKMNRLMKLRNNHPAFDGQFILLDTDGHTLGLKWQNKEAWASLTVNFQTFDWEILYTQNDEIVRFE